MGEAILARTASAVHVGKCATGTVDQTSGTRDRIVVTGLPFRPTGIAVGHWSEKSNSSTNFVYYGHNGTTGMMSNTVATYGGAYSASKMTVTYNNDGFELVIASGNLGNYGFSYGDTTKTYRWWAWADE